MVVSMHSKFIYSPYKFCKHIPKIRDIKNNVITGPVHLPIDITNRCQNKCSFCYDNVYLDMDEFHKSDELSYHQVIRIISEAKDCGVKTIEKTGGGEPLLHPDFVLICSKIYDMKLGQSLISNGIDLEKYTEVLINHDWVRISLNAFSINTFETICRSKGENLKKITNGIQKFAKIKKDCVLGISIIVCPENISELRDIVTFSKNSGVDNVRISFARTPKGSSVYSGFESQIKNETEYLKTLSNNKFICFVQGNRMEEMDGKKSSSMCYFHHFSPNIGANGILYPCCFMKYYSKYNLGNLKDFTFKDIWNGERRISFIRNIGNNCGYTCFMTEKNEICDYLASDNCEHINYL